MQLVYAALVNNDNQAAGNDFIKQHLASNPNDLTAIMMLANMQISDDQSAAIKSYEKALTLNPDNVVALNNLAYFYLEQNNLDKALDYGKRALALTPDLAEVLDTVAQVYIAKSEFDTAVDYLNKAVINEQVSEEIYLNYVEALLLSNDKVLATRKLKQRQFKEEKSLIKVAELTAKYAI